MKEKYVAVLNEIEYELGELDFDPKTKAHYIRIYELVKKLKYAIRDGEPLEVE